VKIRSPQLYRHCVICVLCHEQPKWAVYSVQHICFANFADFFTVRSTEPKISSDWDLQVHLQVLCSNNKSLLASRSRVCIPQEHRYWSTNRHHHSHDSRETEPSVHLQDRCQIPIQTHYSSQPEGLHYRHILSISWQVSTLDQCTGLNYHARLGSLTIWPSLARCTGRVHLPAFTYYIPHSFSTILLEWTLWNI